MAVTLLNCSICPKRSTFSDISHLLTHVSSKGHLSNLHKLQVRSYQEISASHQLLAYNQWYQEHDIGHLLSERMLQRETKNATTRRRTTMSPKKLKEEVATDTGFLAAESQILAVDPRLQQTPSKKPARTSNATVISVQEPADDSDFNSTPVKKHIKRKARPSLPNLLKHSPSEAAIEIPGTDRSTEIDPAILDTIKDSKLKGVLWPGMHLFDAATAEMRRRRNQKKDGSALMQMEGTSKNVQPSEVIFSEEWTSLKQRPITGRVEDNSPLKGESPLLKKPVRRRRPALIEVSANVQRKTRKHVKPEHAQARHRRDGLDDLEYQLSPSLPSSSHRTLHAAKLRPLPTEDETMEFKITVGDIVNRKKAGNFAQFHDKENANSNQILGMMPRQKRTAYPPFATTQGGAQIPFATAFWLQPQYQVAQSYQNLDMTQGSGTAAYYTQQHLGLGKENFEPWFARTGQVERRTDPPEWNHNETLVQDPQQANNDLGYEGQIGFPGLPPQDDVFGYSANPLSAAHQNLSDHLESPFKTSETGGLPPKPFGPRKAASLQAEPSPSMAGCFTTSE